MSESSDPYGSTVCPFCSGKKSPDQMSCWHCWELKSPSERREYMDKLAASRKKPQGEK